MPAGATNGPLFNEIASLAITHGLNAQLENFILGLGGRDVEPEELMETYELVVSSAKVSHEDNKNYGVIG
jgi:pyruvate/2-oxoacid:ferredoxin oxidoreductase alpha subunit